MKQGFSLVELMVVIAIVAILAAVATPVYKNFIISTRMSSVIPVINQIMQKSADYWNAKGTFPIAYDLGYTTTSGSTAVTSPSALSPYLSSLNIAYQGTPTSASCNGVIAIYGSYNLSALGVAASYADAGGFTCYLFNVSGKLINNCSYSFSLGANYKTDNFLSQWYGCQESTCTNPRPYYQQKDGYGSALGFTASDCL